MTPTVRVRADDDLTIALDRLGLSEPRPVIVVVGDAGGMSAAGEAAVAPLIQRVIVPICEELHVAVVDGGTDSGVMRLMGRAHARAGATFPLVGVVAVGTVAGAEATVAEPAELDQNHTGCVLVPGVAWGDESPWIPTVAAAIALGRPVAGVLFGGGEISRRDVRNLMDAHSVVCAVQGSGRLADALGGPSSGDAVVDSLRAADLLIPVPAVEDPASLDVALRRALTAN